jgi:8-oxo-dGTP diphosphatase
MSRETGLTQSLTHLQVAAGILLGNSGQVLITDRQRAISMRDYWEFPGGKLLPGESSEDALHRELAEELGISVTAFELFHSLQHTYADAHVAIDFYLVSAWAGTPGGAEGQQLSWVSIANLDSKLLLPADVPVIDALIVRFGDDRIAAD